MTSHVIDWFAGIDWGSERHQVCILNCSGEIVAEHNFPHTGNGLAEMGRWLANFTAEARNMAVAIEVPHGPVVDLLLDRGFVVYAINPKQLDRLRDRFSIAGSKDDRRDALVAASSLRTGPALVPSCTGQRPSDYRVARMVASCRRAAARPGAPMQPSSSATLAILSTILGAG